jgi:hypothetical protein
LTDRSKETRMKRAALTVAFAALVAAATPALAQKVT